MVLSGTPVSSHSPESGDLDLDCELSVGVSVKADVFLRWPCDELAFALRELGRAPESPVVTVSCSPVSCSAPRLDPSVLARCHHWNPDRKCQLAGRQTGTRGHEHGCSASLCFRSVG